MYAQVSTLNIIASIQLLLFLRMMKLASAMLNLNLRASFLSHTKKLFIFKNILSKKHEIVIMFIDDTHHLKQLLNICTGYSPQNLLALNIGY
jgi:hypothetical protein